MGHGKRGDSPPTAMAIAIRVGRVRVRGSPLPASKMAT
jgi:hypothetical protein